MWGSSRFYINIIDAYLYSEIVGLSKDFIYLKDIKFKPSIVVYDR